MSKKKAGVDLIAAERKRQVSKEKWSSEHDDGYGSGELALAAACYAAPLPIFRKCEYDGEFRFSDPWPWNRIWDKRHRYPNGHLRDVVKVPTSIVRKDRLRELVKAGALIAAEIDRLIRRDGGEK